MAKLIVYSKDGTVKANQPSQPSGVPVTEGGTGANLGAAGPGAVVQTTTGGPFSVETALDEIRGGTGQTSLTTGDTLYASAANTLSKLAIGTTGFFLKVVAGIPAWAQVFYQTIKDGGSSMTQRPALNFVDGNGITVTATDDSGGDKTDVTVTLAIPVKENGSNVVAAADSLDFKDINVEDGGSNDAIVYINSPFLCQGRLTLTSGTAVTTADVTGATSVYFAPYKGSQVSLYDGTRWKRYTFTERSLSLGGFIKGVCYDIFLYDNAGTLTLEELAWKKVTASNNPTAGASKTINLADTSTLAIGMEVTVRDGSNSEVTNITAVVASTSITVDNLANGYTTPDVYGYLTRATALTTQDGVEVKSGATTRRYLGTLRINRTTTGQCEDTASERFLWNNYNRRLKHLLAFDTTDTWNYSSAAWRQANASIVYGVGRVGVVIGLSEDIVEAVNKTNAVQATAASNMGVGIGIDAIVANGAQIYGMNTASTGRGELIAVYEGFLNIGNHYLQRVESSSAATTTWHGDNNSTVIQTGLLGKVYC